MRIISGRKKKIMLNSKSVNAKQITPIVEDTNDMNVGSIRNDIVFSTRSKFVRKDISERIQRETICTEYSTANPTLNTNDMVENPVRLTSAKILRPLTDTRVKIIVTAIKDAPTKLPPMIFSIE